MSLYNEDTLELEISPRPAALQEESVRGPLLLICIVASVLIIFWVKVLWPILLALMVVHVLVK